MASDPLARLLAERIALNARDAGLSLQPTSARDGGFAAGANSAGVAGSVDRAGEMWRRWPDCRLRKARAARSKNSYAAEQAMLATQRLIPLFHLPVSYAAASESEELDAAPRRNLESGGRLAGERETMIFRRKLLAVFALTVFCRWRRSQGWCWWSRAMRSRKLRISGPRLWSRSFSASSIARARKWRGAWRPSPRPIL